MELFYKIVFGFILAITLSAEVLSAPAPSKSTSRVEILIRLGLAPRVVNATEQVGYCVNFSCIKVFFTAVLYLFYLIEFTLTFHCILHITCITKI